jgi:hypothetical protein
MIKAAEHQSSIPANSAACTSAADGCGDGCGSAALIMAPRPAWPRVSHGARRCYIDREVNTVKTLPELKPQFLTSSGIVLKAFYSATDTYR